MSELDAEEANPVLEEEEGGENEEGDQEDAGDDEDDDDGVGAQPQAEDEMEDSAAQPDADLSKPKRKPRAPGSNQLNRQYGGKALLPVSRVQKIIKADKVWRRPCVLCESTENYHCSG